MMRAGSVRASVVGAIAAMAVTVGAGATGGPVLATSEPPAGEPPAFVIDATTIRAAKVGWARFVADNFATPTAVPDPCPLLVAESMTGSIAAVGLVATDLPFGVALYDDNVGAGIAGVRCGVDLAKTPTPSGATSYAVEVAVLDGQATFPQYVARVIGNNTPIVQTPELSGETSGRCRNEPRVCVASWHAAGLVVSVRLDGPRTDESPAQTMSVLAAVVPQVIANLGQTPS